MLGSNIDTVSFLLEIACCKEFPHKMSQMLQMLRISPSYRRVVYGCCTAQVGICVVGVTARECVVPC